ncbi:thioesterase family protein [Tautonia sp. JC769]|uniref:acyl-CoA thioesterase n=1 Tax=Tautonia sp. JC769 TaxID=3232135 RepID=UPI003459DC81
MADRTRFEHPIQVESRDIDRMGHVNNVVYLRYAQDAAVAHWSAVATPEYRESLLWVVRRHEIDYLRPALPGDRLLALTWVGAADGATFERFVEITRPADERVLARVRTVWVALDAHRLRPRRVPEELRRLFEGEAAPEA